MRSFLLIAPVVVLCACSGPQPQDRVVDQCLRQKLFKECMQELPAGPQKTVYNDWDEVVNACGEQAYYGSMRPRIAVDPKCALDN